MRAKTETTRTAPTGEIETRTVTVKAMVVPAGVSKTTGNKYAAFWSLKVEDGKQWIDLHIVKSDEEKRELLFADLDQLPDEVTEVKIALTLRDLWERPKENGKYRLFYAKNIESWKIL